MTVAVVFLLLELYFSGHDVGLGLFPGGVEILLVLLAANFKVAYRIIGVVAELRQCDLVHICFIDLFLAADVVLVRHLLSVVVAFGIVLPYQIFKSVFLAVVGLVDRAINHGAALVLRRVAVNHVQLLARAEYHVLSRILGVLLDLHALDVRDALVRELGCDARFLDALVVECGVCRGLFLFLHSLWTFLAVLHQDDRLS